METIKIKHRLFTVIQALPDNFFLLERKNKRYLAEKFDPHSIEGKETSYAYSKLKYSGVSSPSIYLIDDRNGYAVREYVEGEKVSEILAREDLSENIIEQLFNNAYLARNSQITLNYEPDYWIIVNEKLIYTYPMVIKFNKQKDLVEKYIRLWFNTVELRQYLSKLNINFDKSRVKQENLVNKEIVLMTCKYYK